MFEIHGYLKEYYIGSKLIGKETLETPDRKSLGYTGRKLETLQEDIMFKKLYKKGTEVYTEVSPICGKLLGTQQQKFQILANSKKTYNKSY
jgi:hypothetical protein